MTTTKKCQRATLPAYSPTTPTNARNLSDKKETTDHAYAVTTAAEPVCVRWFMSRRSDANIVHCSIWIRTKAGGYFSGYGVAGGYGYCKRSAAFDAAVRSAGVKLSENVAGVGEAAVREAMRAIARACGYPKTNIVGTI